jgi:hypothetical protein
MIEQRKCDETGNTGKQDRQREFAAATSPARRGGGVRFFRQE